MAELPSGVLKIKTLNLHCPYCDAINCSLELSAKPSYLGGYYFCVKCGKPYTLNGGTPVSTAPASAGPCKVRRAKLDGGFVPCNLEYGHIGHHSFEDCPDVDDSTGARCSLLVGHEGGHQSA